MKRNAWFLSCLLISIASAFSQVPIPDVDLCGSLNCYDYKTWYQVIALPAPAGRLNEFTVLARERQYATGLGTYLTHMEPTLHLSIYPNDASIRVNGMKDYESPTIFSQNFTTTNGLVCENLTNSFPSCADLATNLWRLKVPLNIRVYPGAWFGVWFTYECRFNWTIAPLQSSYGNPMQACRYHYHQSLAYYFQPLISGVPYAVYGQPQLQIAKTTNGVHITWDTNETNLWLTSSQGRLPLPSGNGVSLPVTNKAQIWWLEK